jgi:hypothetical protein
MYRTKSSFVLRQFNSQPLKPPFHRVARRLPRCCVDPHSFAPHRAGEETPSQRMIRTACFVAGNEREPDHHHPRCARAPVRSENDVLKGSGNSSEKFSRRSLCSRQRQRVKGKKRKG